MNITNVKRLTRISMMIAIIVICAQISIPMPYGVPMTLQTFAIPLAAVILGLKDGTIATIVYVLLGMVGVPVFAQFSSGVGVVFGPTGGFILSFPLMAITAGLGTKKGQPIWLFLGLIAGAVLNFACGMIYFSLVLSTDLKTAFVGCVLPFIPTAIIKIILVATIGKVIKTALNKTGVLA